MAACSTSSGETPDARRRSRAMPRSGRPGLGEHQERASTASSRNAASRRRRKRATGRYGRRRTNVRGSTIAPPASPRSCGASAFAPTIAGSTCRSSMAAGSPPRPRGDPLPGVYFLGLPWLYTWGSGRFSGVARDAEYLAEHIEARVGMNRRPATKPHSTKPRSDRDHEHPARLLEIDRILGGGPAVPALSDVTVLGMPHLCLGGLSETWLLRECGHRHWFLLAQATGRTVPNFRDVRAIRSTPPSSTSPFARRGSRRPASMTRSNFARG